MFLNLLDILLKATFNKKCDCTHYNSPSCDCPSCDCLSRDCLSCDCLSCDCPNCDCN